MATLADGKRLYLTLLGGFQARVGQGPPVTLPAGKVQALLASLALPPGRVHPRDKLVALLWGELGEAEARANLRQALFVLRKALPGPHLITEGDNVALGPAAVEVDVVRFERRVAEGTATALQQAAELYQGDLLAGLAVSEPAFEEWLLPERERLRELAMQALAKLLAHQRAGGLPEAAVQTGLRLLALDPSQESVHRTLMRLYVELGRRAAALRQYQQCIAVLQRELGAEPEEETRRLYEEVLRKRPGPRGAETIVPGAAPGGAAGPLSSAPISETPMVGRQTEKERLRDLLDQAMAGRGRLAIVRGDAGIGKTRLVHTLTADAASRGTRVLVGRSYQSEQILPFGPWVDALRAAGLITPAALHGLEPVWRGELARLLPELASAPATQPSDDRRLFEAVTRLVAYLAASQPLVLILEDVHWADEMSARLLAFVGRRIGSWPVLVVATVREEELLDAPALRHAVEDLDLEEHLVHVPLGPLSHADTLTLVTALARPGLGTGALERLGAHVWATSEGNPFMVVETLRALRHGATAEPTAALPERVRDVIARRLERLSERSRSLVALAGVIGREFDFDLLQQTAGLGDREAAQAVEELVRRHVFHGVGERLDFTHDLIRAVAYEQLAPPQRKLLHRVVATTIERVYEGNTTGHDLALGRHYHHAEVWDKAARHLSQAGAQAYAGSAHGEAIELWEKALASLEHCPPSREVRETAVDLRTQLKFPLIHRGELARVGEHLSQAERLAEMLGDEARLARVLAHLVNYFIHTGDTEKAVASGRRAEAIVDRHDDLRLRFLLNHYLGTLDYSLGQYRAARGRLVASMSSIPREQAHDFIGTEVAASVHSRALIAGCLGELGEFDEAIRIGEEAARFADGVDRLLDRTYAHRALAHVYTRLGEFDHALAALERGLSACRAGNFAWLLPGFPALAYVHAVRGDAAKALPLLEETVNSFWFLRTSMHPQQGLAGDAFLLLGRVEEARDVARRALDVARRQRGRGSEAWSLRLLGEIASHPEAFDAGAAESHYRKALALGEELDMRPLVAHCHLGLGKLYVRIDKPEGAREHLTAALSMYGEMKMTFWREPTEAALAELR